MSVLSKLASALDRRDETPNQELARQIAAKGDKKAVQELVDNLSHSDKAIQSDCIKVLYEVGEAKPALIASHAKDFLALLGSKNNRLQWGAMSALDSIASENPAPLLAALPRILAVAEAGSVITRDHGVGILVKLGAEKAHFAKVLPHLLDQLKSAPDNQLPMYAEMILKIADGKNAAKFVPVLERRMGGIEKESKRKRVEKVVAKLKKLG